MAALAAVFDQATKTWAVAALDDGAISLVGTFLEFRLTRNTGAAFSSFTGGGQLIAVFALVVAVGIGFMMTRIEEPADRLALALIMGGTLGNLSDRIFRGDGFLDGAVVDFIDVSSWPTFNAADSLLFIGVAIMLIFAFFRKEPDSDGGG